MRASEIVALRLDDVDWDNGRITILKKTRGASAGVLRHLKADMRFSDAESLRDALDSKRAKATAKKRAA